MARFTFRKCRVCGDIHDVTQWPPACASNFETRQGPQIVSDTIEPFQSMATGETFSSKSRYRSDLRARGMIEVGNERVEQRRVELPRSRDDIRRTMQQLRG